MSYIPDCRSDECYNEKNLNAQNKREVMGYDWCAEHVVDNFFNNLDVYFDDDSYLMHILNEKIPEDAQERYEFSYTWDDGEPEERKVETYMDLLRSKILDWMESERDMMITSMIDHQAAEEE